MAPAPVPDAGVTDNQVVLALALQLKVPLPVLLMVTVCAKGLLPPCWAVKDRLGGPDPITGLTDETTGAEGDDSNCVNPGISDANLLIDLPPGLPPPEVEGLPVPAAASGIVPVVGVPTAMDPVVVVDDGATLIVARGTVVPTVLLNDNGSVDREVVLSVSSDAGGVGTEPIGEEMDGEGSTDATGALCDFRLSRCGLLVKVCASFFSKDFVGYRSVWAMFSMRRS